MTFVGFLENWSSIHGCLLPWFYKYCGYLSQCHSQTVYLMCLLLRNERLTQGRLFFINASALVNLWWSLRLVKSGLKTDFI